MLVLSRHEGESIQLGDDITITVERIFGNRVQISIDAPKEVKILRGELLSERGLDGGSESDSKVLLPSAANGVHG